MTKALSVVDAPIEAEPLKPDAELLALVERQLGAVRADLATSRYLRELEEVEVPVHRSGNHGPVDLHTALFAASPAKDRPKRGQALRDRITAQEAHLEVLESIQADQKALASAYAEWAAANGTEADFSALDPTTLGNLVYLQDQTIKDLEGQLTDLTARLARVEAEVLVVEADLETEAA
jgi:hypothetical protein